MLPQSFPFQLVEEPASAAGELIVRLSAGNALQRGRSEISPILTLEMLAQAAILALADSGDETPRRGFVAGYEAVRFAEELAREPLSAGDELRLKTERVGDFGRLQKIAGTVERRGQVVVRAELMLGFES